MLMMPLSTWTHIRGTVTVTFHPRSIHTGVAGTPTPKAAESWGHRELHRDKIPHVALHSMHGSNPIQ